MSALHSAWTGRLGRAREGYRRVKHCSREARPAFAPAIPCGSTITTCALPRCCAAQDRCKIVFFLRAMPSADRCGLARAPRLMSTCRPTPGGFQPADVERSGLRALFVAARLLPMESWTRRWPRFLHAHSPSSTRTDRTAGQEAYKPAVRDLRNSRSPRHRPCVDRWTTRRIAERFWLRANLHHIQA